MSIHSFSDGLRWVSTKENLLNKICLIWGQEEGLGQEIQGTHDLNFMIRL